MTGEFFSPRSRLQIKSLAPFGAAAAPVRLYPLHKCRGFTLNWINKTPLSYKTNRMIGGAAPSEYISKLEQGNKTSPPILPENLSSYLKSHLIEPNLLRTDAFDSFMQDRQKRLLELIEAAMGKPSYSGGIGYENTEEGEEPEGNESESSLTLPLGLV